jgi:bifunctional DNase/RNase
MVEMELIGVRVELPTNAPIVLLRETEGEHRTLPIFIGGPEATAIAFALEQVETPRPMTHDLMKDVLDGLGVRLDRVVVTELRDSTFYAELHLATNGRTQVVSSRPSDAIALAVRTGTTIFADESVLDEAGYAPEEEAEEEQDEVVEQFKEFIDRVNPEDFAS